MTVLEVTATTAGLARVTRLLADEPLRPGYVSVVGSLILYAASGRRLLVACPSGEVEHTQRKIRAAIGPSVFAAVKSLESRALNDASYAH